MPKKACLFVCPVGALGSKERDRADSVARYVVEPALAAEYQVTSCHQLMRSGEIPAQLKNRLRQDALVIADLTDSNPNVTYEVGLRHAVGLPCIHIAAVGSDLPFDLRNQRTVMYDLGSPAGVQLAIAELRKSVDEECAKDGVPHARSPIELWQEIRGALDPELPEEEYGAALKSVFDVVRKATHGPEPVVRLWGNRGGRDERERNLFEVIARELGRACARAGMAISCTDIQTETLEYWALRGVAEVVSTGASPRPVYLHFNMSDTYARGAASQKLVKELETSCQLVEIRYPYADADRLGTLSDQISREQVTAHDARMGSLLQCDAVVLLGGGKSAQHLVQLMSFLDRHHIRAAKPIVFIPIPWIGGMGRTTYLAFKGVLDDADFVASVTS